MENLNFIEKLNELVANEDVFAAGRNVNELRTKLEDYLLEEERKVQVAELLAKDANESVGQEFIDKGEELEKLKNDFYEVYGVFKEKRKAVIEAKNNLESENLGLKRSLIKKLNEVVNSEENIGAAFGSLKEIQDKWKTIGDIPREKRSEVQAEYSKLLEDFFYNIKIYKDLKDHDFHRNLQLKKDLIEKLKALNELKSIKETETQMKVLQNDWNDIGPVPNENWEEIKESYWTEVRSVYNKVNRFYDDRKLKLQQNLEQKQVLLKEAEAIVANVENLDTQTVWNSATTELLEIQNKWKAVGFGPKKENDEIWKAFRAQCDLFFEGKKAFFDVIQGGYDKIAEKKEAIIKKAEALATSTEWKDTANKLKNLQSQWKDVGHAGKKMEQKLWKSFRAACDSFFDSRQKHFDIKDAANETNFADKLALIEKVKAFKLPEDKLEAIKMLSEFSKEFNSIGHVPIKKKDEVYNAYKSALDKHYSDLNLEGAQKDRVMLEAKIATLQANPNASRLLTDLKMDLRKDIDKLKKEATLLENNLGFFANSKGANALKTDVEKKVAIVQEKVSELKAQLKLIPNE